MIDLNLQQIQMVSGGEHHDDAWLPILWGAGLGTGMACAVTALTCSVAAAVCLTTADVQGCLGILGVGCVGGTIGVGLMFGIGWVIGDISRDSS